MKKVPEKQELFLFSILALRVSLCHLSPIHSGQCILQNLRKVHIIGLRKCIQHSHLCFLYLISPQFIMLPYGYFTDSPSIYRF